MGVVLGIKEDGTRQPVSVDDKGRVTCTSDVAAPVYVASPADDPLGVEVDEPVAQTQDVACSKDIAATSTSYKLPERNGLYLLIAVGNAAYCETADGSAPTATTSAGGFSLVCPSGVPMKVRLAGDYIAWIGASAAGTLSIIHLKR